MCPEISLRGQPSKGPFTQFAGPVSGREDHGGGAVTDRRTVAGAQRPNDIVAPVHPKAMPVILTTPAEIETWMTAPAEEALKLQRPLPDGALRIVATGVKEDGEAA